MGSNHETENKPKTESTSSKEDNTIPKWLKILAFAIPVFAIVVSGLWTAYISVRDFNANQAKMANEFQKQQSENNRAIEEERRKRSETELQVENAKAENLKLVLEQRKFEVSMQENTVRNNQETTRQREIESKNRRAEIESEITKFKESTKQDSIKLINSRLDLERELKKERKEKISSLLKNISSLNDNQSEKDYISLIQNINWQLEEFDANSVLENNVHYALVDGLLSRLYFTRTQAEIDIIEESIYNIEANLTPEKLKRVLNINKDCYNQIIEDLGFCLYNEIKLKVGKYTPLQPVISSNFGIQEYIQKYTASKRKRTVGISTSTLAFGSSGLSDSDITLFMIDTKKHLDYLDSYNQIYDNKDKAELNKKINDAKSSIRINMYKLNKISAIILSKLQSGIDDSLNSRDFNGTFFSNTTIDKWKSINSSLVCKLNLNNMKISDLLKESIKNGRNCQ